MREFHKFAVLSVAVMLTACGGGGGGSSTTSTATGYFKDSNTQGVRYVSGSQSGVTGADGSFTYEVGNSVSFSVGAVSLGSVATGKSVVTPVDLVASGSTTNQAVQNLTRFLMMLDSDGNPANGITISPALQTAAAGWSAVNFNQTETTFNSAVATIVTAAGTTDGRAASLPTAIAAQTHVEGTLRCVRSGGFKGTYGGGDTGKFGVLVDAGTGMVTGLGYSNSAASMFTITGTTPVSLDQTAGFTSGVVSLGATYTGTMTSPNAVSGTWSSSTANGTFSGARVGGVLNAKYRFTGKFQGGTTAYGLYTFDIDGSNNVTGLAYNVPDDSFSNLSGTVSGTTLSGTISTGGTFTATINLATGTVSSATWSSPPSSGTFTASGCQLN